MITFPQGRFEAGLSRDNVFKAAAQVPLSLLMRRSALIFVGALSAFFDQDR